MHQEVIRTLNEYEGKLLLKKWGIPVIEEAVADHEEEAIKHAAKLGYPVALKVCSEEILHKTDQGGVILDIKDAGTLKRSVRDMHTRFKGTPHCLLIQKMASPGIELIVGARRDPVFGPVILAGNEKDAVKCAGKLGYPVALKVCSEAVLHKTDQGGVVLNITDPAVL